MDELVERFAGMLLSLGGASAGLRQTCVSPRGESQCHAGRSVSNGDGVAGRAWSFPTPPPAGWVAPAARGSWAAGNDPA
ncbi:hypothetical protein GCM10010199_49720 [Dactylosporangium roseum]